MNQNDYKELNISEFKPGTAGYVLPNGNIIMLDEYHGEDKELRDSYYPEFSNTHPEEDTCIRVYNKLTKAQQDSLEKIIDIYLKNEWYCKIEIWKDIYKHNFYKIYSLFSGACGDVQWEETVGNWTGYDLVKIINNYFINNNPLKEEYLTETKRLQFISKSRNAEKYKGKTTGRWEAKSKCKVAANVRDYNKLDMDTFWKKDILKFAVKVQGETDTYNVIVEFNNILNRIKEKVKQNKNLLELKLIYKCLAEALNSSDVKVACECGDFKYRFAYWLTQQGDNAGEAENRQSMITNPNNNLGAGCKHILCVLNNAEWLNRIASVINNYVAYCKDSLENLYSRYIFPKIYNIDYNKAAELAKKFDGIDDEKLASDEATLNLVNALGKIRGRIQKGSNKNPIAQQRRQEAQNKDTESVETKNNQK